MRTVAIIPALNEEAAIESVVSGLQAAVPGITVYVYDNQSTDSTVEVARSAGAVVRTESRRGKGNVIRRAFSDVEADVYVMVDGDDTYDASAAPLMIKTLVEGRLDHVLGVRTPVETHSRASGFRPGHESGNQFFNRLVSLMFGEPVTDMLSGYRVLSRRFVKSFPALSREFEIETELTIHARNLRVPQTEIPVGYRDRPEGSESKLRTLRDGLHILKLIMRLFWHERPALFFGGLALLLALLSLGLGIPVVTEYAQTGLVSRFPTAVLASAIAIIATLSMLLGIVLSGIQRTRREVIRLMSLQQRLEPEATGVGDNTSANGGTG